MAAYGAGALGYLGIVIKIPLCPVVQTDRAKALLYDYRIANAV
jgi:hypothetical protein